VVQLSEYRGQLYEYLKSRMAAMAPNLTVMVGELVGARLIAHAGSLVNLSKCPASTIQILGAEKARADSWSHQPARVGVQSCVQTARAISQRELVPSRV
jgi:nucleolar protein 58